ncbi:MAG: MlaD family protein [Spirochaetaceae bacterium]|jgi:phospholipid/cholesterol/gamma-HCH transport system substrate-binding protein|nr:MlaD family protein [Spirochaetaceae bacterium]
MAYSFMRFRIRYSDKIVGISVVFALATMIFVIFMLGSNQRWFSRNYYYKTYLDSAAGLSDNMAVQYKGFTIGRVKSFKLNADNRVEIAFYIYDTYIDKVKYGSLVDLSVSPVGLGNQFRFYPGKGNSSLAEGETIPILKSLEGQRIVQTGFADVPNQEDGITLLLSQANSVMENLNATLVTVTSAFQGTDKSSLGRTITGLENTVSSISTVPDTLNSTLSGVQPILSDVKALSSQLADPKGLVGSTLAGTGDVYTNLITTLESISATLHNVERMTDLLPSQVPGLVAELRTVITTAEDTITALNNNPLLKGGIPKKVQVQSGGTNPRNVAF